MSLERNPPAPYVLVTPTKDEEKLIGTTIESVIRQTIQPAEWVIVSDGSTDGTNALITSASATHSWIRLIALPSRPTRSFSAVVHATELGVRALKSINYGYVGLLDSDVRFAPDYFASIISEFQTNPALGMAGGHVVDVGQRKDKVPRNLEDIPGATQFFRRNCFEQLGGLLAIPEGGWDALTCARARMLGFQTRLLPNLVVDHLKPRNIGEGTLLRRLWQLGVRDYALGYHPLFEAIKCLSRLLEPPILVSACARWLGYVSATLSRPPRTLPQELHAFIRTEQLGRLRRLIPKLRFRAH